MYTENFGCYNCCDGQAVEHVYECLPRLDVTPSFALVVEAVHLRDLSRFVIPAEDRDAVPITQLQRDEEGYGFDGVVTPVDVVAHEEVVRIGRVPADTEELGEVVLKRRYDNQSIVSGEGAASAMSAHEG